MNKFEKFAEENPGRLIAIVLAICACLLVWVGETTKPILDANHKRLKKLATGLDTCKSPVFKGAYTEVMTGNGTPVFIYQCADGKYVESDKSPVNINEN